MKDRNRKERMADVTKMVPLLSDNPWDEPRARAWLQDVQKEASTWAPSTRLCMGIHKGLFSGGTEVFIERRRPWFAFWDEGVAVLRVETGGGFGGDSDYWDIEEAPFEVFGDLKEILPKFLERIRAGRKA